MSTAKNRALDESWFERLPPVSERVSDPPASADLEPARPEGRVGWAMFLGAVGGAGGGAAMLFVAMEVARRFGMTVDIVRTIGRGARGFTDEQTGGLAIA